MKFFAEKDLAMCGLACVLCSDPSCLGCKTRGCNEGNSCSVYQCAEGKELDGCYQCGKFPCGEKMLQGIRNRAFNRYAIEYGKQALLDRLRFNFDNGVSYHKSDGSKGDYDLLSTEEEIIRLIRFGSHDPFVKCPILETELFTLRLVRIEDADDLLKCYSDPQAQEIFDTTSTMDFRYQTLDEMNGCIEFFLHSYENREFVRFSILEKKTNRAIGTVEMFDATGHLAECDAQAWGVLRLDLASPYEKQPYIEELLKVCLSPFYELFGVKIVVIKAIPNAEERIAALRLTGFKAFDWPEQVREHYWAHMLNGENIIHSASRITR